MAKVISLYGGPGVGKSTSAACLYYYLKAKSQNAELVREAAKDWAWDKRNISPYDQLYILGRQIRRESMLYSKVDYIITDSPILMAEYYSSLYYPKPISDGVSAVVSGFYEQSKNDGNQHYHILLKRSKEYVASGRFQTENEAKEVDAGVEQLLLSKNFAIFRSDTEEGTLVKVLTEIISD